MPNFKTREEYERWKTQRSENLKKREQEIKLKGVDYWEAKNQIAYSFALAKDEAQKNRGEYVYHPDLIKALEPFMSNPCFDTAVNLLKQFPTFATCFLDPKINRVYPSIGHLIFESTLKFVEELKQYCKGRDTLVDEETYIKLVFASSFQYSYFKQNGSQYT